METYHTYSLCLSSFTQYYVCEVNSWFCVFAAGASLFLSVFPWRNISFFVYPFICWWTFELFLIWSKYFWGHLFSILVGKYLGVVLLGQRVCLSLILLKEKHKSKPKNKWYSKVVVTFYISTNKVCVFQLFHIQHLLWSVFFF